MIDNNDNNNNNNNKQSRDYWKAEEEIIIQQWADKAQCFQWMHARCREIYQKRNTWFSIPVIIISTITGTANFAQDRFSDDIKEYVVMSIGTLSIIAGIITTIYQFLNISELNEGHRMASLSWSKYHNNLKTLILRHPLDRMPPSDAIKIYKDEYERLIEISPVILKGVLKQFNYTFKKNTELIKPITGNKIDSTEIFSMNNNERQEMINMLNNIPNNKKLINNFLDINGRDPYHDEINNLNTSIVDSQEFINNTNATEI